MVMKFHNAYHNTKVPSGSNSFLVCINGILPVMWPVQKNTRPVVLKVQDLSAQTSSRPRLSTLVYISIP